MPTSCDVDGSKRWPAVRSSGEPDVAHARETGSAHPQDRRPRRPTAAGRSTPDNERSRGASPPCLESHAGAFPPRGTRGPGGLSRRSSADEHVLIELDRIHGDETPGLATSGTCEDRTILLASASSAIEELVQRGIDLLNIEFVLAMLDETSALDGT